VVVKEYLLCLGGPEVETITCDKGDLFWTVTINRPDKLNALNNSCLKELEIVFDEVAKSNAIRVVVLTGAGSKAFVAGADIKELASLDAEAAEAASTYGQQVFRSMEICGKVVIAAVNGFALGGGCELAMAATFRIASDNARFGLPEVGLGLIPGYGGTQRLTRLVGAGRASQMICTGEMIEAAQALDWGLINEICSQEELMNRATQLAKTISTQAPLAIQRAIAAIREGVENGEVKGFEVESRLFGHCFQTEDMKEGTTAFLEKRKANFQGK